MSTCFAVSLYIVFSWQGRTLCLAIYSASSLQERFFAPRYAIARVIPPLLSSPIFWSEQIQVLSDALFCSLIFLSHVRSDRLVIGKIYGTVPGR